MRRVWLILATVAALILAAITLASVFSRLWVDWTDSSGTPFRVLDKLEIAARNYPLKTASASLLCGPDGNHLLVKLSPLSRHFQGWITTDLPGAQFTRVSFLISMARKENVHHVRSARDNVATIVTKLLDREDEALLIEWIQRPAPRTISFHIFEIGNKLSADARMADKITAFLHRCRRS